MNLTRNIFYYLNARVNKNDVVHSSYGDFSKRDPPVPIPNTEVKPLYADGTWLETTWESRKSPNKKPESNRSRVLLYMGDFLRTQVG